MMPLSNTSFLFLLSTERLLKVSLTSMNPFYVILSSLSLSLFFWDEVVERAHVLTGLPAHAQSSLILPGTKKEMKLVFGEAHSHNVVVEQVL